MQVTRQHVVGILRMARLPELAEEAHRVLPDPVEYNDAARFLTLAVLTAQVASSFVAQGASRDQPGPQPQATAPEVTLAELDQRLARIEALLLAAAPSPPRAAAPDRDSGST